MTKKEKLENLLKEIPCLYTDYKNGEVYRYSPSGKYKLEKEELSVAYSTIGRSKLLCVIEQVMVISGETLSLINYVIVKHGFTLHTSGFFFLCPFFRNEVAQSRS